MRAAVLCLALWLPGGAEAHTNSRSFSIWTIQGAGVALYVEVDAEDVRETVYVDLNRDEALSLDEVAASQGRVAALLDPYVEVVAAGAPCTRVGPTEIELATPPSRVYLRAQWRCDQAPTALRVALRLHEPLQVASHKNLANFKLPGGRNAQHVFSPGSPDVQLEVDQPAAERSAWAAFRVYSLLGAEHILEGWDHLLFLLGLLLIWPRVADILRMVTAFTVAHSLTLALAAFDVIHMPTRIVESLIALSILYVAVENIVRTDAPRRWWATFAFGLVHGCGFATVLQHVGLPTEHRIASLLAFNVGVEIGQLAVVVPVVGLLTWGRRLPANVRRRITQGLSAALVFPALGWLAQRIAS